MMGIGTWHLQYGFEDGVAKLMPAMRCYPRLCVFVFIAAWILLLAHSPCSPIVSLRETTQIRRGNHGCLAAKIYLHRVSIQSAHRILSTPKSSSRVFSLGARDARGRRETLYKLSPDSCWGSGRIGEFERIPEQNVMH